MAEAHWLSKWDELVAVGESAALEEFWLARLEDGVDDPGQFLEALKRLRTAGKKTLAATLLELAADQSESDRTWAARRAFVRELVRLGLGDQARWRAALEECVRHLWVGRPSLQRLLEHFNLREARRLLETLDELETWLEHDIGGVFAMAGRGAGRVVESNPQLGVLRLDFERERRVPVPIDAARKYLTALPAGHFLRRRLEEPAATAELVRGEPAAALEAILSSFAEPMTVPAIKAALQGLLPEDQWTSWWSKARKNPRVLASGSGTRVQYRLAGGEGAEEEIRREFASAELTGRLELARRHGGRDRELVAWMAAELLGSASVPGADPGRAWEALAIVERLGGDGEAIARARHDLLERAGGIELVRACSDAVQREAVLTLLPEARPAQWVDVFAAWLPEEVHPRLLNLVVSRLVKSGETRRVVGFLDQVFLHPLRAPAAVAWACETDDPDALPLVDERRTGALLVRLVEFAERREFSPLRARLKEILSARGLAAGLVQTRLSPDQARRLLQILEHPGELAEERAWLGRAVLARFPELREAPRVEVVPALAATVTRLQEELRSLREKEIPDVLKAIQVAKEHGDLRENFEYHAARARQEFLSARAAKLQEDLARVRVIDPATIDASKVRVGTRVWLESPEGGERRSVTILGPYEADPGAGVLSHGTEVAQAMLEKEPGDEVILEGKGWRIAAVEPAV